MVPHLNTWGFFLHDLWVILKSARELEITPGVLEYCLNQIFVEIIMEYDAK